MILKLGPFYPLQANRAQDLRTNNSGIQPAGFPKVGERLGGGWAEDGWAEDGVATCSAVSGMICSTKSGWRESRHAARCQ